MILKYFKNKNNTIDTSFLYFLIFLVPFLATTGNYTTNINRVIIAEIIIILIFFRKKEFFQDLTKTINEKKIETILIALFITSVSISYIFTPATIADFGFNFIRARYLHICIYVFFFISLFIFFQRVKWNYIIFINIIIALTTIIVAGEFIFNIAKSIPEYSELFNKNEDSLFFMNRRQCGFFLTSSISYYIGHLAINHGETYRKKDFFFLVFFMGLSFFYGGRGNLLSIMITFVSCVTFIKIRHYKILPFCKFFFFSILLAVAINELSTILIQHLINEDFVSHKIIRYTVWDRLELWKYCRIILKDNLLFGLGPQGYTWSLLNNLYNIDKITHLNAHPHNFIFQFLIDWGLAGTILVFVLIFRLLLRIRNSFAYLKDTSIIPIANIVGLTAHGFVDGTYFNPVTVFYLLISYALLSATKSTK